MGLVYAFALVAGIAALMIRRVRETVLAMVPLILGTLWTVGVMQLAGLKLNLVNVWAFPLIIGSAAEYGLYIVLQCLESPEHGGGPRLAHSTVMAVLFNGLTTIPGFGSLLVAHHRGVEVKSGPGGDLHQPAARRAQPVRRETISATR